MSDETTENTAHRCLLCEGRSTIDNGRDVFDCVRCGGTGVEGATTWPSVVRIFRKTITALTRERDGLERSYADAAGKLDAVETQRDDAIRERDTLAAALAQVRQLVDQQAEDAGLWFGEQTAAEAYLQQELRKLHAAIETGVVASRVESAIVSHPPVSDEEDRHRVNSRDPE